MDNYSHRRYTNMLTISGILYACWAPWNSCYTMNYRLTPIRITVIKKSTNNKCWRGCGEKGNLLHCWYGCWCSSVQWFSHIRLFATPWTEAHQVSLSITNSWSLLKLMSIELVMPSSHLILCRPLLLLPSIFPSIRVFSNESVLHIRWPKYWSFSFSISPSNEDLGLISFRMGWLDLLAVHGTLKSLLLWRLWTVNTTVQKHQFFCTQLSL